MQEMENLMDELIAGFPIRVVWQRRPREQMAWAPSVEMYEKGDSYMVRVELPGVTKEDVDISVSGETLTIKGERRAPEEVKGEEYHRCELCYGAFSRSISLPAAVETDKIEATYADGILEIRLPKVREAMAARIEIKAK